MNRVLELDLGDPAPARRPCLDPHYGGIAMLVGRSAELEELGTFTKGVTSGRGGTLVVRGEAGVGKTVLVRRAVDGEAGRAGIDRRGAAAVWVACVEDESRIPFATLHDVVGSLREHIDGLPSPQTATLRWLLGERSGDTPSPFDVGVATLGLLSTASLGRPLVVVVDDAHWADRSSLAALRFAGRRIAEECIGLLLIARPGGVTGLDLGGFPAIDLRGVDIDAASLIVTEATGVVADQAVLTTLIAYTRGNPLAIAGSAGDLTAGQLAGAAPLPADLAARAVERILHPRLGDLEPSVRQALSVAAVCRTAWVADIVAALDVMQPGADQIRVLGAMEATGLLSVTGGRVVFRHPLVREACRLGGPDGVRACHSALAEVVEGDDRIWHRAASIAGADDHVAEELEQLAVRLGERGATIESADAFDRAAALSTDSAARRRRLLGAGLAFRAAGALEPAEDRLVLAAEGAHTDVRSTAQEALGLIRLWSDRREEGRDLLLHEAERLAETEPDRAAKLVLQSLVVDVSDGRIDLAVKAARRAEELSTSPGTVIDVLTTCYAGYFRALSGIPCGEVSLLDGARRLATMVDRDRAVDVLGAEGVAYIGLMLVHVEAMAPARELLDGVIAAARRAGDTGALPLALSYRSELHTRQGRWRDSLVDADEAMQYAAVTGRASHLAYARVRRLAVEAMRGRDHARVWSELLALHDEAGSLRLTPAMGENGRSAGLLQLGAGEAGTAAWVLGEVAAGCEAAGLEHPGAIPYLGDLAEARLHSDDRVGAEAAWILLRDRAAALHGGWQRAAAVRVEALLADDVDGLRHAVDLHASLEMPFEYARVLVDLGRMLRRQRFAVESREPLQAALRLFDELGAESWATTVERELRASRAKPASRRAHRRTVAGLTPQEERIALLVAAGATNREVAAELFVAPKTIENSLSRIYAKFGVRSRTELARSLPQR